MVLGLEEQRHLVGLLRADVHHLEIEFLARIALGFPVVVDIDLGENQVPGALESVLDHSLTVKHSLELRNIKIKTKELPIPVAFAAAL